MVEVELNKIIIDDNRREQIIVLKEKSADRRLPIVIGTLEADSIHKEIAGVRSPRPVTHDLLVALVDGLGAKVDRLLIDKLVHDTFHAKLIVRDSRGELRAIDCRPSDGMAVVVRTHVPIFVDEDVFKKSAISQA